MLYTCVCTVLIYLLKIFKLLMSFIIFFQNENFNLVIKLTAIPKIKK